MSFDTFYEENTLDVTPIPIKVMNSEYYTNWLPIELIN